MAAAAAAAGANSHRQPTVGYETGAAEAGWGGFSTRGARTGAEGRISADGPGLAGSGRTVLKVGGWDGGCTCTGAARKMPAKDPIESSCRRRLSLFFNPVLANLVGRPHDELLGRCKQAVLRTESLLCREMADPHRIKRPAVLKLRYLKLGPRAKFAAPPVTPDTSMLHADCSTPQVPSADIRSFMHAGCVSRPSRSRMSSTGSAPQWTRCSAPARLAPPVEWISETLR
jgi:hypothetical protein